MRTLKVHAARCLRPSARTHASHASTWTAAPCGVAGAPEVRRGRGCAVGASAHWRGRCACLVCDAQGKGTWPHPHVLSCTLAHAHSQHSSSGATTGPPTRGTPRQRRSRAHRSMVPCGSRPCAHAQQVSRGSGGVQVFRILQSEPAQPLCVEADDGAGGRKPLRTRTQALARTALCAALLRAHGGPHGSRACAATHGIADARHRRCGECAGALLLRSTAHGAPVRWIW